MRAIKTWLKVAGVVLATLLCSIALWFLWWHAPVSVNAVSIEKANVPGIRATQVEDCAGFQMTAEQFRAYWKDVRPIFEFEFHEYSFGPCYFKTVEDNTEYAIGIGGVGMVTKGGTTYYYVRKDAKPDLGT
jgi:hypothetical protein